MLISSGSMNSCRLAGILLLTMISCQTTLDNQKPPGPGVSWELAQERARQISNLTYQISWHIPQDVNQPVRGEETISFTASDPAHRIVLDFHQPPDHVLEVQANGRPAKWRHSPDHIELSSDSAGAGHNEISIQFVADTSPLNRHADYLYTLFVPNRASAAFPCFDQPDLKARYRLALDVPARWTAVANGSVQSEQTRGDRRLFRFEETKPLSTYLFAFTAGEFQVEESQWKGRQIRLFHRETDRNRVSRNLPAILELHRKALDWLEGYTGIEYPFEKFDFVAVPAFQFSGMEHPGAILYRDSGVFLDQSATQNEILQRASLIAHETSHMWFGDLVTMRWFNDVWTKEVFANFMAAKIVNPSFPEVDHQLRFFLAHYPGAYEVDRTRGTNPIRQELENMNEAGSLYGAIIYQKAPIMMRQLELLIGEKAMQSGLQEYLRSYAFSNATWPELVAILDKRTPADLQAWSRNWVEQRGRPWIKAELELDGVRISSLRFRQDDPLGRRLVWPQRITPAIGGKGKPSLFDVNLDKETVDLKQARGLPRPAFVLPDARGIGYGRFELDEKSRAYLLENFPSLPEAVSRATAWMTLYDALLQSQVEPASFVRSGLRGLSTEPAELNVSFLLNTLSTAYWGFLSADKRRAVAADFEKETWNLMLSARSSSLKAAFFKGFTRIAITQQGIRRLREVWNGRLKLQGLNLSERDYMRLAWELAARGVQDSRDMLARQNRRIQNPDRSREFAFVAQVFSDPDRFFESLRKKENRKQEPWVLEALAYLHHPLRREQAIKYIKPSLDMLEEIQATGDIFFAKGWLDATLSGHNSREAAEIVRDFLEEHPSYPPRLRAKIEQSADMLFRKAQLG
jgi:aminopeptidase N